MPELSQLGGSVGVQHNSDGRALNVGLHGNYNRGADDFSLEMRVESAPQEGNVVETTHTATNPINGQAIGLPHIYRETEDNTKVGAAGHAEFQAAETGLAPPGIQTVTPSLNAGAAANLTTGESIVGAEVQLTTDGGLTGRAGVTTHPETGAAALGPELSLGPDSSDAFLQRLFGGV